MESKQEKCSDCGGPFHYGVKYKCVICSEHICIRHVRTAGGLDICTYCYGLDMPLSEIGQT